MSAIFSLISESPPNNALQQTFDPASRLAVAKRPSASNAAELDR